MTEKVLSTIEDALLFLDEAQNWDEDKPPKFSFDGELGKLQIEIEGTLFHGELTGEVARGLAALQDEIYRATLFAITGIEGRGAKLTLQQKEAVELFIDIEKGCTLINIDIGKLGDGLTGILSNMTSLQIQVLIILIAAILTSGWLGVSWIKQHYAAKINISSDTSETERLEISAKSNVDIAEKISQLILNNEKAARFAKASENGIREIVTRARDATSVKFGRLELNQEEISALKKRAPRSRAEPLEVIGEFNIVGASTKTTPIKLTLAGPEFPCEFDVEFEPNEFKPNQVDLVWNSFRNRSPIELQINAVLIGEKVKGAVLSEINLNSTDE